jgi:C-terminal processing protease CtpA/Prc
VTVTRFRFATKPFRFASDFRVRVSAAAIESNRKRIEAGETDAASTSQRLAALAQDYGFATILGEETADLASTYGAMESFTLPRTGIQVGFPKARILRPSGDPVPRGVVPDVAIPSPLVPGGRDEMLEQALAVIRSPA